MEKVNEPKSWFFENTEQTNLELDVPRKKRTQIKEIRNEKEMLQLIPQKKKNHRWLL